jgi:hypothetical protein
MMVTSVGEAWTFWAFAATLVLSLVFIVLAVPETKGQPLERIEQYFEGNVELPGITKQEMALVGAVAITLAAMVTGSLAFSLAGGERGADGPHNHTNTSLVQLPPVWLRWL